MTGVLRLGTRKSLMATTQSQLVADRLTQLTGHAVELVGVTTEGDLSKALLAQMGGTGVFVSGLRDRLLAGDVDFAVHSLKDLPTAPADGLCGSLTGLGVAFGDHDGRPFLREQFARRPTNALSAAGDDGNFSLKSLHALAPLEGKRSEASLE